MANHKSAKKRAIQNEKKRLLNMVTRTKLKNAIKSVQNAMPENADALLNNAKSVIAKSAKKGVIHKKNAARKMSRISKLVNAIKA